MRLSEYLISEDDQEKIKIGLEEIKKKVEKIIGAIKSGSLSTAAKAVVELTERYGAPFTDEMDKHMLIFSKDKDFMDHWRDELSNQQQIWNKMNPTPAQAQAKSKSQEPKAKEKPSAPPAKPKGDKQGTVDKPKGPTGSHS
jgi:hypothetical protein